MEKYCECCGVTPIIVGRGRKYCGGVNYESICKTCGGTYKQKCKAANRLNSYCSLHCQNINGDVVAKANKSRELLDYADYAHSRHVESLQKKYGEAITNVSQLVKVKEKKRLRGPTGFARPEFREIIQEKYGVANVSLLPEIKEKKRLGAIERYGVDNVFKATQIKDKIKATTLERYGVENVLSLPRVQAKLLENNARRISKINRRWHELITKTFNIDLEFERNNGIFLSDLGNSSFSLEINPTITHNSTISFPHAIGRCKEIKCLKHPPTQLDYHRNRFIKCRENGVILFNYFDWIGEDAFIKHIGEYLFLEEVGVEGYIRNSLLNFSDVYFDYSSGVDDGEILSITINVGGFKEIYEVPFRINRDEIALIINIDVAAGIIPLLLEAIEKNLLFSLGDCGMGGGDVFSSASYVSMVVDNSFGGYLDSIFTHYNWECTKISEGNIHYMELGGVGDVEVYDCGDSYFRKV